VGLVTMSTFGGEIRGFAWEVEKGEGGKPKGTCHFCGCRDLPILLPKVEPTSKGICEPCSLLVRWAWGRSGNEPVPGVVYATEPAFAGVLIVRERPNDFQQPYDVLMVEDGSSELSLPVTWISNGESQADAAMRGLQAKTGLRTWRSALEPLYIGYSPRAHLGAVFLCRGYDSEAANEEALSWRPWPPSRQGGYLAGFYKGVEAAFEMRAKMQRNAGSEVPLSLALGEPAVKYVDRTFARKAGKTKPDDGRMLESWANVMSGDEKDVANVILALGQRYASPAPAPMANEATGDEDELEDEGEDDDGGEALSFEDGRGEGFVRPPPPRKE
jgi:ADP-ribose pyrophosphatase YjhB (NUDIX family)